MSNAIVVIPARLGSTRFPGKVLEILGAFPVVEWCRRAAVRAKLGPVVVATESRQVADIVERCGGLSVLTSSRCRSGTDRAHEAVRIWEKKQGRRFERVINLQGDEPFIRPSTIRRVAALLRAPKAPDMATAVVPLRDARKASAPNVVKAVLAQDGRCLYFSRAVVPCSNGHRPFLLQHIGIYGFKREALERFVHLPPSRLEQAERLEQLRALEAGMEIKAIQVADRTIAIDTPEDLRRARQLLNKRR